MKVFDKKLHEPGGPLHGSDDLELVGFDKKGRLLLIDRDKEGKHAHSYLVDQSTGKIVARTEDGNPKKWEPHGEGYDRVAKVQAPDTLGPVDRQTGAMIARDASQRVSEVVDCHGNTRLYEWDRQKPDQLSSVTITINGESRQFKPGKHVPGVSDKDVLWYEQPHNENSSARGCRMHVEPDGALVQKTGPAESTTYGVDGSIVNNKGSKKEVIMVPGYNKPIITPNLQMVEAPLMQATHKTQKKTAADEDGPRAGSS
jgi:hypothetical protein